MERNRGRRVDGPMLSLITGNENGKALNATKTVPREQHEDRGRCSLKKLLPRHAHFPPVASYPQLRRRESF